MPPKVIAFFEGLKDTAAAGEFALAFSLGPAILGDWRRKNEAEGRNTGMWLEAGMTGKVANIYDRQELVNNVVGIVF